VKSCKSTESKDRSKQGSSRSNLQIYVFSTHRNPYTWN